MFNAVVIPSKNAEFRCCLAGLVGETGVQVIRDNPSILDRLRMGADSANMVLYNFTGTDNDIRDFGRIYESHEQLCASKIARAGIKCVHEATMIVTVQFNRFLSAIVSKPSTEAKNHLPHAVFMPDCFFNTSPQK